MGLKGNETGQCSRAVAGGPAIVGPRPSPTGPGSVPPWALRIGAESAAKVTPGPVTALDAAKAGEDIEGQPAREVRVDWMLPQAAGAAEGLQERDQVCDA